MKSCSFTGHRAIPAHHHAALVLFLDKAIEYAIAQGCRSFYCGGALGFDTLAAKAVLAHKRDCIDVRLCLVLPCKDQARFWNEASRSAYKKLISLADSVEYLSDEYTDSCMLERNRRLVECADIVIAYCSRRGSGAGQTLRLAEEYGRIVYNLYPKVAQLAGK